MSLNLAAGHYLLRALGFDAGGFYNQLNSYSQSQPYLAGLRDSFMMAAGGAFGANMLANLLQSGSIPGAGMMMPPNSGCCCCPGQYAPPQTFDFGQQPGQNFFQGIMNRARGSQFERFLNTNPFARAQAEMMLGGRIIPDGSADGRITVQPFPNGTAPAGGQHSNAAFHALSFLDQISRAASALGPMGGAMFPMMMAGALANVLGGGGVSGAGGGNNRFGGESLLSDWFRGRGAGQNGQGGGQHVQGAPHPAQQAFGMHQDLDTTAILNDSSLTVEDKVTLLIMAIMKKMDKDIEKQAEYVNKLQQQQGGGGKGKGGGGSSPSIDVETMKLKRMIDKRSQMFDMLRQIIDKYNETAKNIIQSIGR